MTYKIARRYGSKKQNGDWFVGFARGTAWFSPCNVVHARTFYSHAEAASARRMILAEAAGWPNGSIFDFQIVAA